MVKLKNENRIKVLMVGSSGKLAGIEIFERDLMLNSDENRFDFSLMLEDGIEAPGQSELIKHGVKILKYCSRKKNYSKYLADLKANYMKGSFDIVHINLVSSSSFELVKYACKFSNAKVVVHSHSSGYNKSFKTRVLHHIGKMILKHYDFEKIACSEDAGDYMFGNRSYKVFHNGVDFKKFGFSMTNRVAVRKGLNIRESTLVIGNVASFIPTKNHEFLIKLFSIINKHNKDTMLLLVGSGPELHRIKQLVLELGLGNRVVFLGDRTDVEKIYSALDVFVMPSISEGLSIAICEAQVNGLPCVTSNGVTKETDISGNVIFLDFENISEWVCAIGKCRRNENLVLNTSFDLRVATSAFYDYYTLLKEENDALKEEGQ